MDKRITGKQYEDLAAAYLEERGFRQLAANFRSRQGEVDLIGIHENCLVFVEVKYRKNTRSGLPEEAVSLPKQQKICLVSDYYRLQNPKEGTRQVRYDVVAFCGDEIVWHKNAFPYTRKGRQLSW